MTLLLKWRHAFQFAGYYAAIEQGYYAEAGLDVTLLEPEASSSSVSQLTRGAADYIVSDSSLLRHHARGDPVVALAAIFQLSPYALLVREDSGIDTYEDLRGRRIMLEADIEGAEVHAALKRAGLTTDDFTYIPIDYDLQKLIDGRVDAYSAYTTDQAFTLEQAGVTPRYLLPVFQNVSFYGDILATSEQEVRDHPERVRKFTRASLKGWQYALDHPEEVIDLILSKYNSQGVSRAHLRFEADRSAKLIQHLLVPVGSMSIKRWRDIQSVFEELDLIDSDVDLEAFVYPLQRQEPTVSEWLADNALGIIAAAVGLVVILLTMGLLQTRQVVRLKTDQLSESEAHLRHLLDEVPACVATLNTDGQVESMNSFGLEMFGAADLDAIQGQHLTHFACDDDKAALARAISSVVAGRSGDIIYEGHNLAGEPRWFETHIVPFQKSRGQPTQLLALTQDLTQRKADEARHLELQDVINQKHKMEALGQLSSGIAHDFNNILAIIMGNTELILAEDADTPHRDKLDTVLTAGQKASDLIRSLLTFSRADSAADQVTDLAPLVQQTSDMLASILPASMTVNIICRPDLPPVMVDAVQLQQVLFNLAINARDAMSSSGTLTIEARESVDIKATCLLSHEEIHGHWVELSVSDTGDGIREDDLQRIFEPFYTTKPVGEGTGLGLSMIHGMMNRPGRHLVVESEPSRGTRFRLLFKAAERPDDTGAAERDDGGLLTGTGQHILVVDDEAAVTRLISEYLSLNNFRVSTFNDSKAALAAFAAEPGAFDLIISDQTMPGLSGTELIRDIRFISDAVPVIVCSGIEINLETHPADCYLAKPFGMHTLLDTVNQALASTR